MMQLSRKTLLALEAVLDVAYNARPDPVQSKEITKRQGIPQRYLEQVMQQLVRHGVLKGVRGPRGGYTLARERRRISVGEIVRIVDAVDEDETVEQSSRSELGEQVIAPLWARIQDDILEKLDKVSMEDLCRHAARLEVPRGEAPADFAI